MCGICGFVEPEGVSPGLGRLARMNQRLFHRGPDGGGALTAHRNFPNAGCGGKIWVILRFLIWHQRFLW
jgi:asparagine synthetase B (glutamine-hydrolysing)